MTVIVTVKVPDQDVEVFVEEKFEDGQVAGLTTLQRNHEANFSVWEGKQVTITEKRKAYAS